MILSIFTLIIFWLMQAAVHVIFKYGGMHSKYYLACFIVANVIGVSSTLLLIQLYKNMSPPLVLGLGIGGSFLAAQLVMAICYQYRINVLQWVAISAIVTGIFILAVSSKG